MKMNLRGRVVAAMLTTVAAATAVLAVSGTPAQAIVPSCYTAAVNSHYVWEQDTWPGTANWSVVGRGPGTLSLTKTVTVGNSYSATASIGAGPVSAGVGFSVTWSEATGTSFSVTVPANETWTIMAGYASLVYQFDVDQVCSGKYTKTGTGWAYEYNHLLYQSYRD
jgi:hypothetical protein